MIEYINKLSYLTHTINISWSAFYKGLSTLCKYSVFVPNLDF